MSTERHDMVRLVFYGCSHRPRMSAMSAPSVGAEALCYTCGRNRIVTGMETTWKMAVVRCMSCSWTFENKGRLGKKRLVNVAQRHANKFIHRVAIKHDGQHDVIKPQSFRQVPLIDDLFLP